MFPSIWPAASTPGNSFLAGHNFTSSYSYDAASNRTGYTAPDGSTNTLNRLSSLGNFWAGTFALSYNAHSALCDPLRCGCVEAQ